MKTEWPDVQFTNYGPEGPHPYSPVGNFCWHCKSPESHPVHTSYVKPKSRDYNAGFQAGLDRAIEVIEEIGNREIAWSGAEVGGLMVKRFANKDIGEALRRVAALKEGK